MKKSLLVVGIAAILGLATTVTAEAAPTTTTHCDTDAATYHVTKDGKNKIKVKLEAHGCVEHTVDPDSPMNVTCSRVTVIQSWRNPPSKVDFLDRKVKTEWSWKKRDTQYRKFQCSALDNANSGQTEFLGGKYRYKSGFTKRCAFPMLKVSVQDDLGVTDASQIVSEDILKIKKVSGWTFKKCNGRTRQLPPAVALPLPNGGSSPEPNGDGGGYGGIQAGEATVPLYPHPGVIRPGSGG